MSTATKTNKAAAVAKPKPSMFSLEDQFSFYGAYHTNATNVAIHIVCVPTILFTALILSHSWSKGSLLDVKIPLPEVLGLGHETLVQFTTSFIVAFTYAAYFVVLEPVAGLMYAPFLIAMGHFSNVFYYADPESAMKYAGMAFVASWIAQFIGHGKFEGRAPALFDSLLQSLVLAVFFVFLEVLFLVGYRPALHKRLQNRIGVAVAEYRGEKARKTREEKKKAL